MEFETAQIPRAARMSYDGAKLVERVSRSLRRNDVNQIAPGERPTPAALDFRADQSKTPLIMVDPLKEANRRQDARNQHRIEALTIGDAIPHRKSRPRRQEFARYWLKTLGYWMHGPIPSQVGQRRYRMHAELSSRCCTGQLSHRSANIRVRESR